MAMLTGTDVADRSRRCHLRIQGERMSTSRSLKLLSADPTLVRAGTNAANAAIRAAAGSDRRMMFTCCRSSA
jgi:hypothetical protein